MSIYEVLLIAVSVAMDAFAVSVCKGMSSKKKLKTAVSCGSWFAVFQMIMPTLGFLLGALFANLIQNFDHWIVFGLLAFLGANMITEALCGDEEDQKDDTSFKQMLLLSLATSIDALAVGISFALVGTNMFIAIPIIGATTFLFCFVGAIIGQKLSQNHEKIATIIGGIILAILGIKILVEHLFF